MAWLDYSLTGTLLVSLIAFYIVYSTLRLFHRGNIPPGPLGLPVIGNFHTLVLNYLRGEHPHRMMTRLSLAYGKVFSLGFGGLGSARVVVLNDFESVSEAFKNPAVADRLPNNEVADKSLGANGVISGSGDLWKHQRRFSLSVFRSFGVGRRSFEERIATEAKYLSQELSSLEGKYFDPKHYLMNATSNIICSVIFGDRFDYKNADFKNFLWMQDQRIQVVAAGGLNIIMPLLGVLSRTTSKSEKIVKDSLKFYQNIIDEHKDRLQNTNECNDLIDLYLKEIEQNREGNGIEMRDYIDETHLVAMIDNLFIAGTETSSNTLAWCILYLTHNQEVQRKIQDEIMSACGDTLPSFEDQEKMPFTEAVILEIQRLRTVVPLGLPHSVSKDTTIQGYDIQRGTFVVSNLWAVLHDPEVWADPDMFKPERFIGDDNHVNSCKEWIPFSTGRRVCLGERLAKMEIFIFLTHLLKKFTFEKVNGHMYDFDGRNGVTFSPVPFKITVALRKE